MTHKLAWQFWIDRGGTFTDVVARHPDGSLTSHKYLSQNPDRYKDAAVFAMRDILGLDPAAPFPDEHVAAIKMGTTVATNALLEREGAKTLLVITKGFADALAIGQQHRADLFALKPERPSPLYDGVLEVDERIDFEGAVLRPLAVADARADLALARRAGFTSAAIVLVHGYRHHAHEEKLAAIALDLGFEQVSVSHRVSPLMKLVPRGDTTVADAYLTPVIKQYVAGVRTATGEAPLYFMQSNGGLTRAEAFEGKDAVLSGPAGGIVGAAKSAERENEASIIGFDMGGTSTDVSHYAGTYERVFDTIVAGVRMTVPMLDIHTVAAGGGSICRFEDGRFQVGPQSAGAMPGPAAYGRGGPITVTDCNVLLGKLQPHLFPQVFGPSGAEPLDLDACRAGFDAVANQIEAETGRRMPLDAIAEGFLAVAVEHMARAIKRISVERGHNIKEYSLLTFGGAGGQHACLVADALGITSVLVPPFAGVLSALGMGLADQRAMAEQALEVPLDNWHEIEAAVDAVTERARSALSGQGVDMTDSQSQIRLQLKYAGSDTALAVGFQEAEAIAASFAALHQKQFGFVEEGVPLIVEAVEAEAVALIGDKEARPARARDSALHENSVSIFTQGQSQLAQVIDRRALQDGIPVNGPAIILEDGSTTIVEPGWQATLTKDFSLRLRRVQSRDDAAVDARNVDPILLEIFNNLYMSVAEEMGGVLAKTAHSVNVKERLDFSCAVFDSEGRLIANAPHMPVHLGSMGESVAAIIAARGHSITADDVFMVNDPGAGGTHLPDITVITPVFIGGQASPAFFVASRGHHADIGGISPGSMPPNSTTLEEEGVCFTNFHLVKDGLFQTDAVRAALTSHRFPARNPNQNLADLKAQVAANQRGRLLVERLVGHYGMETVSAYMGFVRENAAAAVRRVIDRIEPGEANYPMDCGAEIRVVVRPDPEAGRLTIDFTGSSPELASNYNAPFAVVKAAVLYVFRVLAGGDIPLNAGCLEPIDIIAPEGSMLRPGPTAAVVAGNVETSQAITNALFLATGTMAAAQGTMNNVTFGDATHQYYETVAGGTGAGPGFDGTDGIHSHMTNSRLTDVEILEWRYPVLLDEFGFRDGSGGNGAHNGGTGLVRSFTFRAPMEISLLANHYDKGPPGLAGGTAGTPGRAWIERADGTRQEFAAASATTLSPGDRFVLHTPGGGGYGEAVADQQALEGAIIDNSIT